jgi:Fur family ferric uptake transcriptional regulator
MADAAKTSARQRFMDFLAHKNLRLTGQRRAIIATVYRTLPLLTESGLVREVDFGKDHTVYDPNYAERPHHNHIVCQECGRIVEFESGEIEQLEDEISQRLGFTVKAHRLQITASCDEFRRLGTCSKMAH